MTHLNICFYSPTIRILMSLIPKSCLNSEEKVSPIFSLLNYLSLSQFSFLLCVSPQLSHLHLSVVSTVQCTVLYTTHCTGTLGHVILSGSQWPWQVSPGLTLYSSHHTCEAWLGTQGPSSEHWHACCLPACSANLLIGLWFTLNQG